MDKIEVEIENEDMLQTAISNNVDIIMFDNQNLNGLLNISVYP